jgi:broad specificity phosphatase PhoE
MPTSEARRATPRAITAIAALAASALLAGCGIGGTPPSQTAPPGPGGGAAVQTVAPVPPAAGDGPTTMVMVIRHGEKPDGEEPGLDAAGNPDDSSMTRVGWDRAHGLVDLFDPAQGTPKPGLVRPAAIYAAGVTDDGEGQRTRETVDPLADKLGITAETRYGKGEEEELVEHVLAQPGPTLISWQHGEIPTIAEAFPSVTPTPPSEWPDDRFDVVWTFTKTADGWHFDQVPELVLPQDVATVIEDDDDA